VAISSWLDEWLAATEERLRPAHLVIYRETDEKEEQVLFAP
jgi:hypothetical protein